MSKSQFYLVLKHSEPFTKCLAHTFDSEEYWECMVRHLAVSGYHISASCKMGPPSDKTSVVDPELKVHGIEGLRVVDASVFPNVTSGNTMAPTLMVAEKAADIIKKYIKINF
ncbi:hypothetical protein KUTeg_008837 [Tegillarca granosa]|uniref:Glucose-methanol-choline oxidoreductase C-terminal domain-containing protein n=1 Tax=Tegillarca granosa TaxID=220873 RepID=A0ABQ9FDI2_TEGGR|nr:hypothetical protein KUTeg_008837 [Tegillarca granosa]